MEYKLGKLEPRIDKRNFKLTQFFKAIEPAPRVCHNDTITNNPMYGNDQWGNCVIAMRAHGTRRFEQFEQGTCLNGTDEEVLSEYWIEGGAIKRPSRKFFCLQYPGGWSSQPDNGLVILDSLNSWRKNGWTFAGQKLDIWAYAQIDYKDPQKLMDSIYYLNGAYCGVALPDSAKRQEIWDIDNSEYNKPGSWGLHAIYLSCDYDMNKGLFKCITWGKEQWMTYNFIEKYMDEAYAIVDNRNKWINNSPVDIEKLSSILNEVTK